jgi:hypothetical protein
LCLRRLSHEVWIRQWLQASLSQVTNFNRKAKQCLKRQMQLSINLAAAGHIEQASNLWWYHHARAFKFLNMQSVHQWLRSHAGPAFCHYFRLLTQLVSSWAITVDKHSANLSHSSASSKRSVITWPSWRNTFTQWSSHLVESWSCVSWPIEMSSKRSFARELVAHP